MPVLKQRFVIPRRNKCPPTLNVLKWGSTAPHMARLKEKTQERATSENFSMPGKTNPTRFVSLIGCLYCVCHLRDVRIWIIEYHIQWCIHSLCNSNYYLITFVMATLPVIRINYYWFFRRLFLYCIWFYKSANCLVEIIWSVSAFYYLDDENHVNKPYWLHDSYLCSCTRLCDCGSITVP